MMYEAEDEARWLPTVDGRGAFRISTYVEFSGSVSLHWNTETEKQHIYFCFILLVM